ncbi:MAG: hypothetical protein HGGPFJEG_00635 [Ignavibacteria bacterium]|nr:hypothetical protein [Ignavibacteria bacterium]
MPDLQPYLTFNGNCEEAFNFYKSVFGGEFIYIGRFSDMPSEYKAPESEKNLILHVSLPIGKNSVLMGSDTSETFGKSVIFGNNISISINTSGRDETEKLFNALAKDGNILMPLGDMFWGAYFGMCKDKFGINWMVSYEIPKVDK